MFSFSFKYRVAIHTIEDRIAIVFTIDGYHYLLPYTEQTIGVHHT